MELCTCYSLLIQLYTHSVVIQGISEENLEKDLNVMVDLQNRWSRGSSPSEAKGCYEFGCHRVV